MANPKQTKAPDDPGADLALPRPPGAIQRWLDRHPRTVDWTIAVACQAPLLVIAIVLPATGTAGALDVTWTLLTVVVGFVALLLRRRLPLEGTIAVTALPVIGTLLPLSNDVNGWIDVYVLLYSLGVHSTTRRMWIGYGIASLGAIAAAVIAQSGASENPLIPAAVGIPMLVFYLVPTLLGMSVGGRRRYIAAIIARAEDLARERDQRARLAVTEERARVAREMHDIVSHGLTVMVTLSEGAAARAEAGAQGAPAAMRRVASAGRDALADMRRLLGLLRDPDAPADLAPQPTANDVDDLIEGFREAGMPVRWTHSGAPLAADDGGRPDIPLAAYRIMQEGLTNVLRHAPGTSRVDVTVDNRHDELAITIENGRPDHRKTTVPEMRGAGRGLIGARERAALHGGTIEAGPTPRGGWRLRAVLRKDMP
ncbi:sensor histidine kinase [Microbacterium halotolerans]|uniref:sensor histidine kinase n=1 Tax=Microbacterium halotolerans TaxID=246613 RepID=UPI0013C353A9|nr:histidine kinase [Microbacterium halotolerans]